MERVFEVTVCMYETGFVQVSTQNNEPTYYNLWELLYACSIIEVQPDAKSSSNKTNFCHPIPAPHMTSSIPHATIDKCSVE